MRINTRNGYYVYEKTKHLQILCHIDINGNDIERVSQTKVLGVTSDLSWSAHVDELVSKAKKECWCQPN